MSSSPMDLLRTLVSRCAWLIYRRRLDAELDEELHAHVDLAMAENVKKGMPSGEARLAALRALGGVTQTRESYREHRGFPGAQHLGRDLRFAFRQLRKSPGFAFTAIFTLALGIGANSAIFSVMNAVLLRTLPVHEPGQLFYLTHENMPDKTGSTGDSRYSCGINIYNRLREDHSVVSDIIAYVPLSLTKTAVRFGDRPEEARADEVSGNFFSALGVSMAAGQPFASADEVNHSSVAVLSYGYWTARFDRAPGVIGKTILIRGVPFTILGVAAPHFYGVDSGGTAADLWVPLQNRPELPAWGIPSTTGRTIYSSPDWWAMMLMARLKPGITVKQAAGELSAVYAHASYEIAGQPGPNSPRLELQLVPARGLGTSSKDYDEPLHVLMGMVVLVLVIACINIVMLLIARNSGREREFALRLSLGAGRWPLFRQLLAESLILVTAGVALGWLFAVEATRQLALWSQLEISLAPDSAVLAFTLGVSAFAAILFGVAPLRTAILVPVGITLKSTSSAQSTGGRSQGLSSRIFIAVQMAFCCVLLFASGLLMRTLLNYRQTDLGMHADSVLAFGAHPLGSPSYATKLAFYRQLLDRLRTLPGVRSATLAELRPGTGWSDNDGLIIDGREYPWDNARNMLRSNWVAGDFFQTLGIPILAGRPILDTDTKSAPLVAVINQTLADRYFGRINPIGHYLGGPKLHARIIGIVRDNKYSSTDEGKMPMSWYSYQQSDSISDLDVEVGTMGNPVALLPGVQHVVHEVDPGIPLGNPQVLSSGFEDTYLMPALVARLAVFFGGLAALLVAVGLYGTLAYRVNRRSVEIGVRLALGAQRSQVLWMVVRDSLYLVATGVAVGLPLAWLASRWLASMMFQLSVHDPFSFAAAVAGVTVVSLAAAVIPARRAASVDPMRALRSE
jgi:predicted permease